MFRNRLSAELMWWEENRTKGAASQLLLLKLSRFWVKSWCDLPWSKLVPFQLCLSRKALAEGLRYTWQTLPTDIFPP